MFEKTNLKGLRTLNCLLVLSWIVLWLAPAFAVGIEGGDSPQAVFKAAQEAGAKKDFITLSKLVAPSEHALLAFGTDMGVGMFVEFYEGEKADEMKKKYEKIQKKYKVNTEDEDESEKLHVTDETSQEEIEAHMRKRAKKLFGHVDAAKYVPDLMDLVINLPEMAEQTYFPQESLTDLKIDGDTATGKAGDKTIHFIKESGRWYLTADVMN